MNLNKELKALGAILDCPVKQDKYTDAETRFMVFTYENEETELAGDNEVLIEKATIQLSYYVPGTYNYFADKETIKQYLRKNDYFIKSLQVFMDDEDVIGDIHLRRLLFIIEKAA